MTNIVIATTTLYEKKDYKLRLRLALKTIRQAKLYNFPIVILDASPDPYVSKLMKREGAEVISQKNSGFGDGIRKAFQKAAKMVSREGVIVWQEPEKSDFVRFCRKVASVVINNKASVVIPERTPKSLTTYPLEQVCSERFGNLCIQSITGKYYDYFFGPRVYKKSMIKSVLSYKGKLWDAHTIPALRALKRGEIVKSIAVDYKHPQEQKKAEEGKWYWDKKRLLQLSYILPIIEREWGRIERKWKV